MPARTYAEIAKSRGLPVATERAGDDGFRVEVMKAASADERLVFGWVSVVTEGGQPVTDLHGDVMAPETLEKAIHGYVRDSRVGKNQHAGDPAMEMVEAVVLTKSKQDALGIDLGREGAFCGFYVHDDATWAAFKDGSITGFSIGGSGIRVPMKG